MNSNQTLRFPRTAREAGLYGAPIGTEDRDWGDKLIAWLVTMGLAFILGMLFGASIV